MASSVSDQSRILRVLERLGILGARPFVDHVAGLRSNPHAMYLYHQRLLVYAVGALAVCLGLALVIVKHNSRETGLSVLLAFAALWTIGATGTRAINESRQRRGAPQPHGSDELAMARLFSSYFLLDSWILVAAVVIGVALHVPVGGLALLLVSCAVICASFGSPDVHGRRVELWTAGASVGAMVYVALIRDDAFLTHSLLDYGVVVLPTLGAAVLLVLSAAVMARLHNEQGRLTRRRLELLGEFEQQLSTADVPTESATRTGHPTFSEKNYAKRLRRVLRRICESSDLLWVRSACFWTREVHQDRGWVLLPQVAVEFSEAERLGEGIDESEGFLAVEDLTMVSSLASECLANPAAISLWRFRTDQDAPAACVPLSHEGKRLGYLTLYGAADGAGAQLDTRSFLKALGSIVASTMEQWAGRFVASAQNELDDLLVHESLEKLFPRAVDILQKYLLAGGCMIVFRPDPDAETMTVVATRRFGPAIKRAPYRVGVGLTGRCAAERRVLRIDDAGARHSEFDAGLFRLLEVAHGRRVRSWMAVPIGGEQGKNYGVIKVVNSVARCSWFTAFDEEIGIKLGLRLRVMIERFRHAQDVAAALARSQQSAEVAVRARAQAESAARERQQALVDMTHQLQGGLVAAIGGLSGIDRRELPHATQRWLSYAEALIEDSLALSFGTSTALARVAGKEAAFNPSELNVPGELRRLAERLQLTNARSDLSFSYTEDPGFPAIAMDRSVFTSVMYSLIHNAMKYADIGTVVTLSCGLERRTGELAVKVKSIGLPIESTEQEAIFERFRRGHAAEHGHRHSGLGLGLWVARDLMLASGGELRVELTEESPRLSVFVVVLPGER